MLSVADVKNTPEIEDPAAPEVSVIQHGCQHERADGGQSAGKVLAHCTADADGKGISACMDV